MPNLPQTEKEVKSSSLNYINTCEMKIILLNLMPQGSSLFEGYFQFPHHSSSEETILAIHLLFTANFRQKNGEEKAAEIFIKQ